MSKQTSLPSPKRRELSYRVAVAIHGDFRLGAYFYGHRLCA